MTKWENTLAKEFKKRDNQEFFGAVVGTILSINPLKIGIYDHQFLIDNNNGLICKTISDLITNNELMINDKVLIIATENNQTFFIIDKII